MGQEARVIDGVELPPAGTYVFDQAHTMLAFNARHMLSRVRGAFIEFEGKIVIGDGLDDSSVEVQIQTASITTNQEMRDNHLKSGDFLSVEDYPTMTFKSTAVRPTGGNTFELDGDLAIKDITKLVTMRAVFEGWGPNMDGVPFVTFSAKTSFEREDWDMAWNVAVETGGWLVGKKVDLEIDVEAVKAE